MEEILELQRRLAEVQATTTSNKFSDRVIVELVNKITAEFQLSLLYSIDGQEYMTPEHLDEQILQVIHERGRMQLIDMPVILNVSQEAIEGRLVKLLKKHRSDIFRLEGELLTSIYLNSVCEEINEDLQQRSQILLSEITSKHSFTMTFLKGEIETRIESGIIQGVLVGGEKLCTSTFQELTKAKFRGILRAATKPTQLSTLAKDFSVDPKVLATIVDELIAADEIEGKAISGSFTPTRFLKNQETVIRNFFKQNSYIEYSMLSKQLFIQKPQDFLKHLFKDNVILLDDCAFYKDALLELNEQIVSFLDEEGYVDLSLIFPTILTPADIETIVNKHLKLIDVELDETFLFNHKFLEKCMTSLKERIVTELLANPEKQIQQDKAAMDSDEEEEDSRGGKKKGGKQTKRPPAPSASASARVEPKKKNQKQQQSSSKSSQANASSHLNSLFNQQEFIDALLAVGVLKKEDRDEIFEQKLFEISDPRLQKFIEQTRKEVLDRKKSAQSEAIVQLSSMLEESLIIAQLSESSIAEVERRSSEINSILLSSNLLYAMRLIMENAIVLICKKLAISLSQGLFIKKDEEDVKQNIQIGSVTLKKVFKNKDMLQQAITLLPKEYSGFLLKALELYLKKNSRNLLEHLMNNAALIGVRAALEKKIEKSVLLSTKYVYRDLIKKDKIDYKANYARIVVYSLIDKYNLVFAGNLEPQFVSLLSLVLSDLSKEEGEFSTIYTNAHNAYKAVTKEKKEDSTVPASGVSDDTSQAVFESTLYSLIKAMKI